MAEPVPTPREWFTDTRGDRGRFLAAVEGDLDPSHDTQDEQAAREWADAKAAEAGYIWIKRFPSGKDWGLTA